MMQPEENRPCPAQDSEAEIVAHIPALRAFARRFHREQTDADDLVQETLMKAIAAAGQFTAGTSMKSWLFTIMRNTFNTRIKIAMREAPGSADCVASRAVMNATQEWSVQGREVSRAIDHLSAEQRQIVVLIGVMGVSYQEAADICGCAVGTVKSRLNRARLRLLDHMGESSQHTPFQHDESFTVEAIAPEMRQ
jgi:RNA polymerase sigma factor, sigma-70 family